MRRFLNIVCGLIVVSAFAFMVVWCITAPVPQWEQDPVTGMPVQVVPR